LRRRDLNTDDPVLIRFRAALAEHYGERLDSVILFGSRACGDAGGDSDYDIAVFLKQSRGFWNEGGKLGEIETDVFYEHGAIVNAMAFPVSVRESRSPLMHELRRDGIVLR